VETLQDEVIAWLARQEGEVYLVGGCVRDRLLGRPVYDLDVATAGDGLHLARRLANHFHGAYYALDEARSTGRAILREGADGPGRLVVDVARLRGGPEGGSLAEDLADRDFTVNALAAPVQSPSSIVDQHGGLADLQARLLRPVSEASVRNDPVRAVRAVRLAATLGFCLAPETEAAIRRDGHAVARAAGERVRDELARLLALPHAAGYVTTLDELGVLTAIFPELEPLRGLRQSPPHGLEALPHSLEVVRALEALVAYLTLAEPPSGPSDYDPRLSPAVYQAMPYAGRLAAHLAEAMSGGRPRLVALKLTALLHDVGKAPARSVDPDGRIRFIGHEQVGRRMVGDILRRLRLDAAEVRLGETVVGHHMRPPLLAAQDSVSARAVYRFFRDTGSTGIDVLLHALADHLGTYRVAAEDERWPEMVALAGRMLAGYWLDGGREVSPPRLIDGADLLREFGLQPGPQIGELLELVREAQAAGEVESREEALALVGRAIEAGR
jgi:tRNA nucleotidyltransferase/poly(A) polymerase